MTGTKRVRAADPTASEDMVESVDMEVSVEVTVESVDTAEAMAVDLVEDMAVATEATVV